MLSLYLSLYLTNYSLERIFFPQQFWGTSLGMQKSRKLLCEVTCFHSLPKRPTTYFWIKMRVHRNIFIKSTSNIHELIHINTQDLSIFHFYFTGSLLFLFPDSKKIARIIYCFACSHAFWHWLNMCHNFPTPPNETQRHHKYNMVLSQNAWISSSSEYTAIFFYGQICLLLDTTNTSSQKRSTRIVICTGVRRFGADQRQLCMLVKHWAQSCFRMTVTEWSDFPTHT